MDNSGKVAKLNNWASLDSQPNKVDFEQKIILVFILQHWQNKKKWK